MLCGRVVFRDPRTRREIGAPSDDDAADAVHALISASRDVYPLAEKEKRLNRILGDDTHAGLVQVRCR